MQMKNGKDLILQKQQKEKKEMSTLQVEKLIPGYVLVRVDGEAKGKIGTEGSTVT